MTLVEQYIPSPSFRMATNPKAKYRMEIDSIALLLIKGRNESAFRFMREMRLPERMLWTVCVAGILRWVMHRDGGAQ